MKRSEELIRARWPDMQPTKRTGKAPPRRAGRGRGVDMDDAIGRFAPGWKVKSCGSEENPGLRASWGGRRNVLVTHPLDCQTGCVLSRELVVPAGKKTVLKLDVGHDRRGDWTLAKEAHAPIFRVDGGPCVTARGGDPTASGDSDTPSSPSRPQAGIAQ